MRLLLVEDDAMIGASVQSGLRQEGYSVDWVRDGAAAELALANGVHEMILLDLGLPRKTGLELLAGLRRKGLALPVLVITARDSVADRVKGLDAGADDYLVKPFDLDELSARIRALLRRHAGRASPVIENGALILNPATHEVLLHGAPVEPQRLAQEAAVLADRSDIAEELVRLRTHAAQLDVMLSGGGEVGKRLDFLLQEMNREANTVLSKTGGLGDLGLTMTELALAAKSEIDKIREQSLNLE